jgi:hypothetical protein
MGLTDLVCFVNDTLIKIIELGDQQPRSQMELKSQELKSQAKSTNIRFDAISKTTGVQGRDAPREVNMSSTSAISGSL